MPLPIVLLVALAAAGCANPQPPSKSAPTPQPAIESAPPPLSLIDPRLRTAWPDDRNSTAWFTTSGYQVYARRPGEFVAIRAPTLGALHDAVVSGTFRKVGGPPGGGYGLIVRDSRASAGDGLDQSGEYIVAGIGDRGEVGIWQRENDRWHDIIPWTPSSAVHEGTLPNELTIAAVGQNLRFDVNGTRIASIESPLASGSVGIFVGGDLNEVLVERLVVQPTASGRSSLAGRQQEIAAAQSRIGELSAQVKQSTGSGAGPSDVRWRNELGDVLDLVQQLGRDADADDARGPGKLDRLQRVRSLLGQLEEDVVAVLDSFSDGFQSPRSPLTNRAALDSAAARLDSATRTAEQIRAEVEAFHGDSPGEHR